MFHVLLQNTNLVMFLNTDQWNFIDGQAFLKSKKILSLFSWNIKIVELFDDFFSFNSTKFDDLLGEAWQHL